VVTRLDTYSIPVDATARAYMDAVLGTPSFRAWREAALAESWVLTHDEVDEPAIADYRNKDKDHAAR
jgi:glutathione S-transferase